MNLLFFPSMIASIALLFWVFKTTKKEGMWPTERFFGFERRRPFQLFGVIKLLRKRVLETQDVGEARRCRKLLNALYWGYGLNVFALAVLLAFAPWLFFQVP
jgi:hypothetical protein